MRDQTQPRIMRIWIDGKIVPQRSVVKWEKRNVELKATASDNVAVVKMEVFNCITRQVMGTSNTPEIRVWLNEAPKVRTYLLITAYDQAGNQGASYIIWEP